MAKKIKFKIDGKIVGVGDKIIVNGEELVMVDFMTDGRHHEFCVGNPVTREAWWGVYLVDRDVEMVEF